MRLPKRSRIRRVLKWAGFAWCLIILAAWVGGLWWHGKLRAGGSYVRLGSNSVDFGCGFESKGPPRFSLSRRPPQSMRLRLPWLHGDGISGPEARCLHIPHWILLFVVATPTTVLFWRDRRRPIPPGHCQTCGYNLTGNVSGVCPECGTGVGGQL